MSYFPEGMPTVRPGPEDHVFWDYCQNRELRIQQCARCATFRHPPAPICPKCRSFETTWTRVSGTGEVFSYTIAYHPVHPALKGLPPYNIAIVLLDGAGDVRLVSNVMDAAPKDMRIGLRVKLAWDEGEGRQMPRFVRAEGGVNA